LAPEVISNQPGQVYDGQKADLWSCGVLLFILVTDQYPFRRPGDENLKPNQKLNVMLQRILRADYTFPKGKVLSDSVRDLIGRVLVQDPAKRPTLEEIQKHPWFMQGLNPAALQFNDAIVAESLSNQPSQAVLNEVRSIVHEAGRAAPEQESNQTGKLAGGGHIMNDADSLDAMIWGVVGRGPEED
jgi:serine/threonine-protein kinase SRK2